MQMKSVFPCKVPTRNYYNKGPSCSGRLHHAARFHRPRRFTSGGTEAFNSDPQGRRPGHGGPPSLCPAPPLNFCKQPHTSCLGPVFSLTQTSPASKRHKPRAHLARASKQTTRNDQLTVFHYSS